VQSILIFIFQNILTLSEEKRSSIAVITGKESKEELQALGKIFFTTSVWAAEMFPNYWFQKDYKLILYFESVFDFALRDR